MRKEEETKEEGIIEPNEIKNNNHSIIEMKEKEREGESQNIKRNDPDNRARGDTKGVDEVDEESEESEEEVEKEVEEEEEEDLEYFDTFPTVKELGYHEWLLKNPRPPRVNAKVIFDKKKPGSAYATAVEVLILYQAYGNLYAMTALGWHLEEIYVTWAHLGKKQTRLQLYTKVDEEIAIQWLETTSQSLVTASEHQSDGVRKIKTATPEQNGVVERRNRTLVEAARTMLSAAKVPLFLWAEAIATTCFTQNHSLVIPRHEKTPYHIINARNPSVKFFHIFGSLCYIVRDGENLDKMKEKGDECIFVGYSTQSRAYRVFNKRTRIIVETIHVNFDELPQMASDHVSSDPVLQCSTTVLEQDSLSLDPQSQENVTQTAETVTTSNELDLLFSLMFDELLNGTTPVVSKSSTVHAADALDKRQHQNTTHSSAITVVAAEPPLNIHTTP
ncbi:retrovirus-related pol polyprotein from transposon TNT 1-94 [Tanacetum coccineum]